MVEPPSGRGSEKPPTGPTQRKASNSGKSKKVEWSNGRTPPPEENLWSPVALTGCIEGHLGRREDVEARAQLVCTRGLLSPSRRPQALALALLGVLTLRNIIAWEGGFDHSTIRPFLDLPKLDIIDSFTDPGPTILSPWAPVLRNIIAYTPLCSLNLRNRAGQPTQSATGNPDHTSRPSAQPAVHRWRSASGWTRARLELGVAVEKSGVVHGGQLGQPRVPNAELKESRACCNAKSAEWAGWAVWPVQGTLELCVPVPVARPNTALCTADNSDNLAFPTRS
jgi:hypothetical protein